MANIVVRCEGCGKRYQIGERLGGKRVKCKTCGAIMTVPGGAPATATSTSATAEDLATPFPTDDPFAAAVFSDDFAEPNSPEPASNAAATGIRRARLDFPHRKEVMLALPWVLVGIGLLLFGMTAYGDASDAQRPWLVLVQFGVALLLYLVVVVPLSVVASGAAGKRWGYTHLPPAWAKMAAAFAVPLGLMYVFFDLSGYSGYAIGFILGLPIAFFTLWLLFRLQLIQAVWSAIYSGLTFVILAVGMAMLSVLVSNVISNAVVSYETKAAGENAKETKKATPESHKEPDHATVTSQPSPDPSLVTQQPPLAPGEPAPPTPVQPQEHESQSTGTLSSNTHTTTNTPQSSEPQPAHAPSQTSPTVEPEPKPTEPIADVPTTPSTPKQGTGAAPGAQTAGTSPQSDHAPYIKEILVSPQDVETFDRIIYPATPGEWMAVVRRRGRDEDFVERFNARALQSAGNTIFKHKPDAVDEYILSANGDWFVRITDWPQLSAQVWSFQHDSLAQSLQLNSKLGSATLLGFLGADQFVVYWDRKSEQGLELWDAKTGAGRRPFQLISHERSPGNLAISPDGRTLAVVAKGPSTPRSEMLGQLYLYDMTAPGNRQPRRLPIVNLDPRWPVLPSGVAFSPDGQKISVLFEQNNNALLLCWELGDSNKLIAEHTYPGGLLPSKDLPASREGARRFTSRALDWLGDGKTWLIYGSGLFDVDTGRLVAQLGVPGTIAQRVVGGDDVHLISDAGPTERKLTVVKLDLAKLAEWKTTPRRERAADE